MNGDKREERVSDLEIDAMSLAPYTKLTHVGERLWTTRQRCALDLRDARARVRELEEAYKREVNVQNRFYRQRNALREACKPIHYQRTVHPGRTLIELGWVTPEQWQAFQQALTESGGVDSVGVSARDSRADRPAALNDDDAGER